MTPTPRDIKSLFGIALELKAHDERSHFLDTACAGDPSLRAEVEELILATEQAGSFLLASPLNRHHPTGSNGWQRLGMLVGAYQLQEMIGEGGMGVVYLAEQQLPVKRRVALKIIKPGMDSRQVIARFEAERQALALMDHPHIAKVLDAGTTDGGLPYFVMEWVQGVSLTDFCDQRQLVLHQRLALFVQVCRAIQHAHQKGIIHRDIKPTNILVAVQDDIPIPKVIDFGVAKAVGGQPAEQGFRTTFAQLIGTPLYMSPEQADQKTVDIDTRSDVYSLGVVLYELLTGSLPFDKATLRAAGVDEMRQLIRTQEPPRPSERFSTLDSEEFSTIAERRGIDHRQLRRSLRGELDWIVMKAIDKDRDRRYATASDLAEDIERYLNDLPILARPSPWWLRLRKWRRRHPLLTVSAAAALLFVAALVGAAYYNQRLSASLAVTEQLKREGLAREQVLRHELYANDIQQASALVSAGKSAEARQILARHRPPEDERDLRGLEWAYLWNLTQGPLRSLSGHAEDILSADVSPDHQFIASGDRGGAVKIWNLATGAEVKSLQYSHEEVTCVRFSPDGKVLATAGKDTTIRLWAVGTWTQLQKWEKHRNTVTSIAFSPDGGQLASSGRDHWVHIWDCATGSVKTSLPENADVVRYVAWSPDGKWLATADVVRGVLVWETTTWNLLGSLPAKEGNPPDNVLSLAFSPDSQLLAYGGYSRTLRVTEIPSLSEVASAPTSGSISAIAFLSPSSLAVGSTHELQLLDVNRAERAAYWSHAVENPGGVPDVVPADRGKLLVIASEEERKIKIWDLAALVGYRLTRHEDKPIAVAPQEEIVAGRTPIGRYLTVRRIDDGERLGKFRLDRDCQAVFSLDGRYLAFQLADKPWPVAIVDTKSWQIIHRLALGNSTSRFAFSSDSAWLAMCNRDGLVGAWNIRTGDWHEILPMDSTTPGMCITALAFSPTENLLAATRWNDQTITLWGPDRGIVSRTLPAGNNHSLAFSHDGKTLAAAGHTQVALWDVESGRSLGKLFGLVETAPTDSPPQLAFSPEGSRLVAATDRDRTIRFWDLTTHRQLLVANIPAPIHFSFLTFRSSRQLAVGSWPDSTIFWFEAARDE